MKIVFMGTPDFAAQALEALIEAGHEVAAVVTQPDKPRGRSGELKFSPVKECALRHGIFVFQPERIKRPEAVETLKSFAADIFIVAAYGQILSQEILDMPQFGCVNIHASLLPKYRGASPIQHAIIRGEKTTGITIMQMDAGVDTGDMLYQRELPISHEDTFETLHDKLKVLGGEAVVQALDLLEKGELFPKKQAEEESSYAPLIDKKMGCIDFGKSACELDRLIRGMTPWPSAYTFYHGKQLKIWKAIPKGPDGAFQGSDSASREPGGAAYAPGEIVKVEKDHISVATGQGFLEVYELQLEGKKRMQARDFLLGVRMKPGERLGQE